MELELVKQKRKQKTGIIALYFNEQLERLTTYSSVPDRKRIMERWQKETQHLTNRNNVSIIINPEL